MPELTVLIVNWRSKDLLRRCLETVYETGTDFRMQIIVVDSGSYDGCQELLAREFPAVEFVQSEKNIGFGQSNNMGAARARHELLLLLNPDTEVRNRAILRLYEALVSNRDAGVVAPRLLNTDGTLQLDCVRAAPTPLNRALDSEFLRRRFPNSRLWGFAQAVGSDRPTTVDAVSGACMLIRTQVFRQIRGFSPEFFMYGEDMDLCAKVRRLGLSIYHVPDAIVVHHSGASSRKQVSQFGTLMMREAGATYMRLNHGRFTAGVYRALQAVSAAARLILLSVAFLFGDRQQREQLRPSLQEWTYVLSWSLGFRRPARPEPIVPPLP